MTDRPFVQIVLPAYNGGKWIEDTLSSILAQSYENWQLIIRDDGSNDGTLELLEQWKVRFGDRLKILVDEIRQNLGSSANCLKLLAASTAPYVLFTGQDDVWFPERIKRTLDAFRIAETETSSLMPIVVASDAEVVDGNLLPIAASFYKWSRIDPDRINYVRQVAMEGPVLGAAMAMNRAMIEFALPLPDGFYDEDFWFGIVAVAFGKLVVVRQPAIRYRRHGRNASDNPFGSSSIRTLARVLSAPMAPRRRLRAILIEGSAPQAWAFYQHYKGRLAAEDAVAVQALGSLPQLGWFGRRVAVLRYRLWYASAVKNIGMMVLL